MSRLDELKKQYPELKGIVALGYSKKKSKTDSKIIQC